MCSDSTWRVKRIMMDFARSLIQRRDSFRNRVAFFRFSHFVGHFQPIRLQGKRKPNARDIVLVLFPPNESRAAENFQKSPFSTGRSIRKFRTFGAHIHSLARIYWSCKTVRLKTKTKIGTWVGRCTNSQIDEQVETESETEKKHREREREREMGERERETRKERRAKIKKNRGGREEWRLNPSFRMWYLKYNRMKVCNK